MNSKVIITMSTLTVASAVAQKIFSSVEKNDEAQYLDLATKAGLGGYCFKYFRFFCKSISHSRLKVVNYGYNSSRNNIISFDI